MISEGHGLHGEGTIALGSDVDAREPVRFCVRSCGRLADVAVTTGVYGDEHAATLARAGHTDDLVTDVEWMCAPCAAAAHPDGDGSSADE